MNQSLTDHVRMRCRFGHALEWRGRWVHVNQEVEAVWAQYDGCPTNTATYPRSYFKEVRV